MKGNTHFLAHQIARFGAMTVPQMQFTLDGKCSRATIYRILENLFLLGYIKRTANTGGAKSLFSPRASLYLELYGKDQKRVTGVSEGRSLHANLVCDSLLGLSRYSYVSGLATEYEVSSDEVAHFCYGRIPDGILQITNDTHSFEVAVEIERTQKDDSRIDEILEKYKQTFMRGMPCGGLLVVTKGHNLFETYQSKIEKLPPEIEKKCLVIKFEELSKLNPKFFGQYRECPQSSLERVISFSHGQPRFSQVSPIVSTNNSSSCSQVYESSQNL